MNRQSYVLEDPHAPEERRYRGYVVDSEFGATDAAADSSDEALDLAEQRWRLRWLGVECPGIAQLPGTISPMSGQVALNGHRYALWRQLGTAERCICWIMLNPSTADHTTDDATLRRIREYSKDWGFGWLTVGNLWSYRATDPKQLKQWVKQYAALDRRRGLYGIMAENERYVLRMANRAELVVCAWGADGALDNRADEMLRALEKQNVHALAVTKSGQPKPPVRLAANLHPRPLAELRAA